jgi:hypothetical protein
MMGCAAAKLTWSSATCLSNAQAQDDACGSQALVIYNNATPARGDEETPIQLLMPPLQSHTANDRRVKEVRQAEHASLSVLASSSLPPPPTRCRSVPWRTSKKLIWNPLVWGWLGLQKSKRLRP